MALPTFSMRQLVEAGCHFGHATRRWNPKMAPFLYGDRDNIHIIDLRQTMPALYAAMEQVRATVSGGGRVLFVGTKRQAQDIVAEEAQRCGQYFVNHRWLGGMLTNWKTVSNSIKRLKDLEEMMGGGQEDLGLTKKERLNLNREYERLDRALGGIKDMGGQPDILFVIDTNRESLAIQEAKKLGVPVIAVLDSNSNPKDIDFPVPGNDDAIRAIRLYCSMIAGAALDGIQAELTAAGVDIGAAEEAPAEPAAEAAPAEAAAPAAEEAPAEEAAAPAADA